MNERLFEDDRVERSQQDVVVLAASVNPVRLSNNPVPLSEGVLADLYRKIMV